MFISYRQYELTVILRAAKIAHFVTPVLVGRLGDADRLAVQPGQVVRQQRRAAPHLARLDGRGARAREELLGGGPLPPAHRRPAQPEPEAPGPVHARPLRLPQHHAQHRAGRGRGAGRARGRARSRPRPQMCKRLFSYSNQLHF